MVDKASFQNSLKIIITLWDKLSSKRRKQLYFVFLIMLITGLADMLTLSAVVPFLIIITDPSSIWNASFIPQFASLIGVDNQIDLVVPITILFSMIALSTGIIRVFNLRLNTKMAAAIGNDLSCEAYGKTLLQPYIIHIQSNSSEVINSIVNNIHSVVNTIDRVLTTLTSIVIVINILIGLLIFNKFIAITVGFILFIIFYSLSYFSKLKLKLNSKMITQKQQKQIKITQESLGSIRDIILFKAQDIYFKNYKKVDKSLRNLQADNSFLGAFPKYAVESFALFALISSSLLFRSDEGFNENNLVILGVFALAAQRLLPNLQQIYLSLSSIRANSMQTEDILQILEKTIPRDSDFDTFEYLKFNKSLKLENVSFQYVENGKTILKEVNFELLKGECIGIIGKTGGGKSTLIDIILGLLKPSKGKLLVDGKNIHDPKNPIIINKWRNSLTYVPQNIFLTDNSIKENIAFGIPINQINMDEVINCAKQANIHDFINSNSSGYETFVGERGIKLSGGQIQRIAIARALYKKSKFIIFDEATSSLDYETEKKVIDSIKKINKSCTIIMIAHRLNTLENCDKIIEIESGNIKTIRSPKDLNI